MTEPLSTDVHRIEIPRRRFGWGFWGMCSCGWMISHEDRREVEIEARLHTLKAKAYEPRNPHLS